MPVRTGSGHRSSREKGWHGRRYGNALASPPAPGRSPHARVRRRLTA
ncbi:hypothetical protein SHJG_5225 [Streptomyces hygroscopicus subsp. jinggangensis 5008]|nr:hypothetical protein SHJG_5225 [Streptomyces hygroscopicus subsp. jinggangensis 5008]AGF64652.1 hypothetical protein SHJGH_4989 [Streptomyces hygroscopicus subsp. jinggangensis TL01]